MEDTEENRETTKYYINIFRKCITALQIRDTLLLDNNTTGKYEIGPTILYIPTEYVKTITNNKTYTNYVFLNSRFELIEKSKGSIFIKMSMEDNNVHLCSYLFQDNHITIFDPAWHPINKKNEYTEDEFYKDLETALKKYRKKYSYHIVNTGGVNSIQNYLINDIFCQSWSLEWLLRDGEMVYPRNKSEVVPTIISILQSINVLVDKRKKRYIFDLPKEKWDIDNINITRPMITSKWDKVYFFIKKKLSMTILENIYDRPK
jgi:hypothetical protein